MFSKTRLMVTGISLIAAVLLGGTALAKAEAPQSDSNWQAQYWNNTNLSGTPVLQRSEAAIDYDWGGGSPDPKVNKDNFSARWTRNIDLAAGTYRFSATSDDGIRVWVDGVLIIDAWNDHVVNTFTADRAFASGSHAVKVEYYEHGGGAIVKLVWAPVATTITNWQGEYFNNMGLKGTPALVRDDVQVNFDWGGNSPAPGIIGNDVFSVRWTRTINLTAGTYRFEMTVDDGARLWVNNSLVIDCWYDQTVRTYTADVKVSGGAVPIKMEYYEHTGGAIAKLTWNPVKSTPAPTPTPKSPTPTPQPKPPTATPQPKPPKPGTVIVDDSDAGFVKGGPSTDWRVASGGYKNSVTWTPNSYNFDKYNWGRWYPALAAGTYEVFVYIPETHATATYTRYWVRHSGGYTLKIIDQWANRGKWISLGKYEFKGTGDEYVALGDATYESKGTTEVAFDAMKWEPR